MVQVHNLQVNSRTTPTPPPHALDFFVHFNHHQNNKHRALQCGLNYGKNSAKKLTFFFYQSSGFLRQHYIWDYVFVYTKLFLTLKFFWNLVHCTIFEKKICSHVLKEVEIESQLTHTYSMLKRFILIKNMNLSGIISTT